MRKNLLSIICFLLSFICCVCLAACNGTQGGGDKSSSLSSDLYSSESLEQSSQTENSSSSSGSTTEQPVKKVTKIDEFVPLNVSTEQGRYVPNTFNKPTLEAHADYSSIKLEVTAGERYIFTFAIQSAKSCGVILANANNTAVQQLFKGENKFVEYNNIQILVPSDVKYVYVNTRSPKALSAQKLIQTEKDEEAVTSQITGNLLTVGTANCGQFTYTDGTTSASSYQENWQAMLQSANADLFMFEDVVDNFSADITTDSVINIAPNKLSKLAGLSDSIRLSTRFTPETMAVVPLANSIEGSSKLTKRFYAVRFTFHMNGKHIAIYGLHLVAEGHISAELEADGTSLSQKLRQKQFQGLINDAKFYDESILIGDFNAQKPEEYDIFKNNGYSTANCGDFGTVATLRDIPADNIIVSSGFTITEMGLLNQHNLSTDHTAFCANLTIK